MIYLLKGFKEGLNVMIERFRVGCREEHELNLMRGRKSAMIKTTSLNEGREDGIPPQQSTMSRRSTCAEGLKSNLRYKIYISHQNKYITLKIPFKLMPRIKLVGLGQISTT
jgi:hypothetical protein